MSNDLPEAKATNMIIRRQACSDEPNVSVGTRVIVKHTLVLGKVHDVIRFIKWWWPPS
jgi:hypothetical protein